MNSCGEITIAIIKNTPKNIISVKYVSLKKKKMYIKVRNYFTEIALIFKLVLWFAGSS